MQKVLLQKWAAPLLENDHLNFMSGVLFYDRMVKL
jgi:hypothetical protein